MKELRNDSRFVRIGAYVCIALSVIGAIWYIYRAITLIH
jgi:hypothetical protein